MKPSTGDHSKPRKRSHLRLLSALLEDRALGWSMLGGGLVYFAFSSVGIRLFPCPLRELTGLKCPGCGLTTGSKLLLQGQWEAAFHYNWFTLIFMIFWAAVGLGLILPEPGRSKYLKWVQASERITHWPLVLGITLLIYALTRNIIAI